MTTSTTIPATDCPSWCEARHDRSVDDKQHELDVFRTPNVIAGVSQRINDNSWIRPVSFEPLADLLVEGYEMVTDLSAERAREIAAALTAAADRLDAITDARS